MSLTLRDYQQEAVDLVMASWQSHCEQLEKHLADVRFGLDIPPFEAGRELIVIATGGGKTHCFGEIARRIAEQGVLTLVLAHRDDLLDQAIDKYKMIRPEAVVGKVKGPICELGGEVTVASVASACKPKRLKQMQQFNYGMIVVDESHHCSAASYQAVLQAFPHAFVLMVTATPDRLDNKPIIDKPALYTKGIIDLVKLGHLCAPKAIAIKTEVSLDEVKTTAGDFNERELSDAVDTPARNKRIADAYLEHADGMPFIAFCVTVQHAESLAYTLNNYGICCAVVTGKTTPEERKRMYEEVQNGAILGLVSVQVLTEGFDLPKIQCVIMARPTKSRSLYVQCVGRGARLFPGKEFFIVLDITDNCLKHRLTPHNLNKALNLRLKDNETIEEAEEREQREAEEEREKEAQIRRLKDKRKADLVVDLLQKFDWKLRASDGAYILEFGHGHRMALKPEQDKWNPWDVPQYSVWARLAGAADIQKWSSVNLPLIEALQFAEARVLKIQDNPKVISLYDKNAPWLKEPPTDAQRQMAIWYKIEVTENMSKGELSELIGKAIEAKKQRKKEKEERKLPAWKR